MDYKIDRMVKYVTSINGEDVFVGIENKKFYIRQKTNEPHYVRWYSASKWSGGFEASCPIKSGVRFRVYTGDMYHLFSEIVEGVAGAAKKEYDFYDDMIKNFAENMRKNYELTPHNEWREEQLKRKAEYDVGEKYYNDTWIYSEREEKQHYISYEETIYGINLYKSATCYQHNKTGDRYIEITLVDKHDTVCYEIVGYVLNPPESGFNDLKEKYEEPHDVKMPDIVSLKDCILPGFTYEELVDTVCCNCSEITEKSVIDTYRQIIEIQLEDSNELLKRNLQKIIEIALSRKDG